MRASYIYERTGGNDESERVYRLSAEDNWSGARNVYTPIYIYIMFRGHRRKKKRIKIAKLTLVTPPHILYTYINVDA